MKIKVIFFILLICQSNFSQRRQDIELDYIRGSKVWMWLEYNLNEDVAFPHVYFLNDPNIYNQNKKIQKIDVFKEGEFIGDRTYIYNAYGYVIRTIDRTRLPSYINYLKVRRLHLTKGGTMLEDEVIEVPIDNEIPQEDKEKIKEKSYLDIEFVKSPSTNKKSRKKKKVYYQTNKVPSKTQYLYISQINQYKYKEGTDILLWWENYHGLLSKRTFKLNYNIDISINYITDVAGKYTPIDLVPYDEKDRVGVYKIPKESEEKLKEIIGDKINIVNDGFSVIQLDRDTGVNKRRVSEKKELEEFFSGLARKGESMGKRPQRAKFLFLDKDLYFMDVQLSYNGDKVLYMMASDLWYNKVRNFNSFIKNVVELKMKYNRNGMISELSGRVFVKGKLKKDVQLIYTYDYDFYGNIIGKKLYRYNLGSALKKQEHVLDLKFYYEEDPVEEKVIDSKEMKRLK